MRFDGTTRVTQVTRQKVNEINLDEGVFPYRPLLYRGNRPKSFFISFNFPCVTCVTGRPERGRKLLPWGTRCDYRSANTAGGH
jgi:hypothetical protein